MGLGTCEFYLTTTTSKVIYYTLSHTSLSIIHRIKQICILYIRSRSLSLLNYYNYNRFLHASEVVGRKIVIHGGWDGTELYNDLWIFNSDSFSWIQPKSSGFGPSPRYGHSLTLTIDGRLIVYGGCSFTESGVPRYNDDIRQLDTDTMLWTRPKISGHIPTGRYGHSATMMSNNKIFFYGGWGKGGCQSKDIIDDANAYTTAVLDIKTMYWYVPRRLGYREAKHLYNHTVCKSSDSSIFIFGGYDGRQSNFDFFIINVDTDTPTY